jgi:membrane protein YqaA with SNARE-associated domain
MRIFSVLYDKVMAWSRHRFAPRYLAGLSFAESSFFPIPPDVMLAPMSLSQPQRAWFFAGLTTIASVVGGIAGYMIGLYFFDILEPYLHQWGYWEKFIKVRNWFDVWGFWAILIAGFSPIPYKLFTISAGVIAMPFLPFVLASVVGRGARFYLVSGLMVWGGASMEKKLRQYIDRLGWFVVILILVAYLILRQE